LNPYKADSVIVAVGVDVVELQLLGLQVAFTQY
jgi:hypothetical protein